MYERITITKRHEKDTDQRERNERDEHPCITK